MSAWWCAQPHKERGSFKVKGESTVEMHTDQFQGERRINGGDAYTVLITNHPLQLLHSLLQSHPHKSLHWHTWSAAMTSESVAVRKLSRKGRRNFCGKLNKKLHVQITKTTSFFFFYTLLTNPQMKVGISFVLVCKCSMNNKKAGWVGESVREWELSDAGCSVQRHVMKDFEEDPEALFERCGFFRNCSFFWKIKTRSLPCWTSTRSLPCW